MFGLEGSGFIISLGVTLLLCGVIAYYVKTQFAVLDHKVSSMFQLVSALTGEVNKHDSWWAQANNEILADERARGQQASQHGGQSDNRVPVSDSEASDSETEVSDTESEDNLDLHSSAEDVTLSGVQHLTMGSELVSNSGDEVKIVELQMNNLEEFNLDDNVTEDPDNEEEHESESESESISDTDDDSESMITQPESVVVENVAVVKLGNDTKSETKDEVHVDYKKLQVKALRKLVKDRGLSENPSKINKKDLVKLLQA